MLELQNSGVHNINLVTPTHFSLQLKQALIMAKQQGLQIPVVWNTNSWEKVEMLRELEGLVDIYLADLKYGDNMMAKKYSAADNYFPIATAAVKEMYRQVGNIVLADNDIAIKGIAIRILVLPHDINSTSKLLHWVADNIGNKVNLSLMSQYYPTYKANKLPELSRNLLYTEYEKAVKVAEKLGFDNCLIQELSPSDYWTPDFDD